MRILFLHNYFPGHYQHVAAALAADSRNQVVFITRDRTGSIPGVDKRVFTPARRNRRPTTMSARSRTSFSTAKRSTGCANG